MKFDHIVIFDGKTYAPGEEVPDLGSFTAISAIGSQRSYSGLSADIGKLPKYDDLATGSSAYCTDTAQLYMYDASTKTWYEQ